MKIPQRSPEGITASALCGQATREKETITDPVTGKQVERDIYLARVGPAVAVLGGLIDDTVA